MAAKDLVTIHSNSASLLKPSQTLRAATALLSKIEADRISRTATTAKTDLLAGADEDGVEDDSTAVWLVLTTKKHIVDKKRLKPGKILLPHPYHDPTTSNLRICLITADPQRTYKDLIADPTFPLSLSKQIGRVIALTKLKTKYKSFESLRQLRDEYDVFLADDRIITYLPQVLGKTFYKSGSKRPVPVTLEGKRLNVDEQGNKRRKLAEGGSKVVKSDVRPVDVARDIQRALSSALIHLTPSTTTAVKVGNSTLKPQQLKENVEAVTEGLVEKYVPQKWRNVRSIHIKAPETAALPIWLAEELWEDEEDVLEEPLPEVQGVKSGKRKRGALEAASGVQAIEVPGADGKMRRVEKPVSKVGKLNGNEEDSREADAVAKAARKTALQKQKAAVKNGIIDAQDTKKMLEAGNGETKAARKTRAKAADLI